VKALPAVQAGYGLVQLAAPGLLAERLLGLQLEPAARTIARVVGRRQLAQACMSGPAPTAAVLALGPEADALHAASMIGLAILGRRWRRAVLASAIVAAGFATAGGLAAQQARRHPPKPAGQGSAVQLRDRWAARLAPRLIPGYAHSGG
jgi:hypothetical protein